MIFPLIGARLHGWLDDIVVATYVALAWLAGLSGAALGVALLGAAVHFANARMTDYPQGQLALYSFRTHAWVELVEGIAVLAGAFVTTAGFDRARMALLFLGASQLVAFSFSDYAWPKSTPQPARTTARAGES